MKWNQIAQSKKFKSLDLDGQQQTRDRYFDDFIAPKAEQAGRDIEETRSQFMEKVGGAERPGFIGNSVRLAGERAGDLMGDLMQFTEKAGDFLEENVGGRGGIVFGDGFIPKYRNAEEFARLKKNGMSNIVSDAGQGLKDLELGGESRHNPESVKAQWKEGDYLGVAGESAAFATESLIQSVPDMAATVARLPLYVTSFATGMGEKRAINKGKPESDLGDIAEAAPFALGVALLERIVPSGVFSSLTGKAKSEAVQKVGTEALKAANTSVKAAIAKGVAGEALTEFVQEGILEYVGERLGTDAKMKVSEAVESGAWAALAGAGGGGAMGGVKGLADSARDRRNRIEQEASKQESELANDSSIEDQLDNLNAELANEEVLSLQKLDADPLIVFPDGSIGYQSEIDEAGMNSAASQHPAYPGSVPVQTEGDASLDVAEPKSVIDDNGFFDINAFLAEGKAEAEAKKQAEVELAYTQNEPSTEVDPVDYAVDEAAGLPLEFLGKKLQGRADDLQAKAIQNATPPPNTAMADALKASMGDATASDIGQETFKNQQVQKFKEQRGLDSAKKTKRPAWMKVDTQKDDIMTAISKLGGLNMEEARSQGIDKAHFGDRRGRNNPFRAKGKTLDAMAEDLSQYGYVSENYTANDLLDKVSSSLSGEKHYTPDGQEHAMELELIQRNEDQAMRALDEKDSAPLSLGYDVEAVKADTTLSEEVKLDEKAATLARIITDAEKSGVPLDYMAKVDLRGLNAYQAAGKLLAEKQNYLGANDAGLQSREHGRTHQGDQEAGFEQNAIPGFDEGPTATETRGPATEEELDALFGAKSRPQKPLLESYSESDLQARSEVKKQSEEKAQAQESKAEQDRQVDEFALTGSNRVSDEAAARGQEDIFSTPTAKIIDEKAKPSSSGHIPDTGKMVRHPWEMTSSEWKEARESVRPDSAFSKPSKADKSRAVSDAKRLSDLLFDVRKEDQDRLKDASSGKVAMTSQEAEEILDRINTPVTHRDVIEKAIRDGKPVSKEILNEYGLSAKDDTSKDKDKRASKSPESYGFSYHGTKSGGAFKSKSTALKAYPEADIVSVDGGYKAKTGSPMSKTQAKEFIEYLKEHPLAQYPRVMGNREKPLSVSRPDLYEKLDQANEALGQNYWQIDFDKVKTIPKFSGLPKSKWIEARVKRGLDVDGKYMSDPAQNAKAIDEKANEAATSPLNDKPEPTEKQKESGRYAKGHIEVQELAIAIENPRGSTRSGTDPNGKQWAVEMKHHYGEIKKTEGADGDAVDVFVGSEPESEKVFVVDQVNADGTFDEHKVMLGFSSKLKARNGYKSNYDKGWKVGPITKMDVGEFKAWLNHADTTQPINKELRGKTKADSSAIPEEEAESSPEEEAKSAAPLTKKGTALADKAEMKHKETEKGTLLYSKYSKKSSGKGITLEEAEQVRDEFIKKYPGVGARDTVRVYRDEEQAFGPDSGIEIKGGFYEESGHIILIASRLSDRADALATLQHEAFAHKGLGFFDQKEVDKALNLIHQAVLDDPKVRGIWADIGERYGDEPKHIQLEEVLASIAEKLNTSKWGRVYNKVLLTIKKFFMKVGMIKKSAGIAELRDVLYQTVDAFERGDSPNLRSINSHKGVMFSKSRASSLAEPANAASTSSETTTLKAPAQFFSPPKDEIYYGINTDKILRKISDKFRPLLQTQKKIIEANNIKSLPDNLDAYKAEEAFHGKTKRALELLDENHIDPLVKEMVELGIGQEELDMFLWARHAKERNAQIAKINPNMQDGGSGMSDKQADDIISMSRAEGKHEGLVALSERVYAILKHRQDIIKDTIADGGLVDAWNETYKFYVPLKGRAVDEVSKNYPKAGKGFDIRGKESLRALGRRTKPESPLLHAIKDTTESEIRVQKNKVGNTFLRLIEAYPNEGFWNVYTAESPEMEAKLLKNKDGETVGLGQVADKSKYFTTKRNGVEHYIDLADDNLLTAMKNLGPSEMGAVVRMMGHVSRFLSSVNTTYSPEFVVSNAARDIQTAVINLLAEQDLHNGRVEGKKLVGKMVKGLPSAARAIHSSLRKKKLSDSKGKKWQKYFDEFREDGAETGWFDLKDVEQQADDLSKRLSMASKTTKGTALRALKSTGDFITNANSSIENAARLSVYLNAREAGVTRVQAASLAKNLTVNFNRKGEWGQTLNALFMFTNASIQGTATFTRAIGTLKINDDGTKSLNKAQKLGIGIAGGAMALAALNREMAGDDDDGENWYSKVPDYVKERNIVMMKSIMGGPEGEYWTIPLPYGYNIFSVIGTSIEAVSSGDKKVGEAAAFFIKSAIGSFMPIGIATSDSFSGSLARTATPTALKPLVDLAVNENFFGSNIYRENYQFGTPRPDSQLSKRSTSTSAKWLAEFLNDATLGSKFRPGGIDINPDKMEYLFKYFTGSAGAFVERTGEAAYRTIQGVELEDREIPFLRKVSGKVAKYDDSNKYYDRKDEIAQHVAEYKSLKGRDRSEFFKKHRDIIKLQNLSKGTEKRLRALRKKRNAILDDKTLTPKSKDLKLKIVEKRMNSLIDKFNAKWPD